MDDEIEATEADKTKPNIVALASAVANKNGSCAEVINEQITSEAITIMGKNMPHTLFSNNRQTITAVASSVSTEPGAVARTVNKFGSAPRSMEEAPKIKKW